jgi:GNAT superfamily N-acetyltransferase
MAERRVDVLRLGADRLRVGTWRGDERVAYIAPLPDAPPTTSDSVRRCLDMLAGRGYDEVVTAALAPTDLDGFLTAGFSIRERLHLLSHDLCRLPPVPSAPLRRARRADRAAVLAVDSAAFPSFWRLDGPGLDEALRATPTARFRVAADPDAVGYAIVGRAGRRGYLQRLAVAPHRAGAGLGTALVLDGLHWARRRAVVQVVVNTQESNEHALALYERLGFRRQAVGLAVLQAPLR